jgi:hypothetical protein
VLCNKAFGWAATDSTIGLKQYLESNALKQSNPKLGRWRRIALVCMHTAWLPQFSETLTDNAKILLTGKTHADNRMQTRKRLHDAVEI